MAALRILLLTFTSRFVIDFLSIRKVIIFLRKTYCARSRNDVRRLTSRSNGMPSKTTMESLEDVRSCRNCSKAWPNVSK